MGLFRVTESPVVVTITVQGTSLDTPQKTTNAHRTILRSVITHRSPSPIWNAVVARLGSVVTVGRDTRIPPVRLLDGWFDMEL